MGRIPGGLELQGTPDAERRDGRSHAERGNQKRANCALVVIARAVVIAIAATLAVSQFAACLPTLCAAEPASTPERIDPDGIKGALVICGGGILPDSIRDKFIDLAGGKRARLVIIPTGSGDDTLEEDGREVAEIWKSREPASITIVHTRSPEEANNPQFVEPIRHATGVW